MARRILLILLVIFIALSLGALAYAYWVAKRAEPAYSGEVQVRGLEQPVRVRFGPNAVPTVEARSLQDLLFAQGFVVASERMWQMDLMRRLASGRLAEVFGRDAVDADRLFRTLGLKGAAEKSFEALGQPYRRMLESYAAGVNAYLRHASGRLPIEYLISRFEPVPWTPVDSLVIGEYMSWTLSFNAREELAFMRMAGKVGADRAAELFPVDEGVSAPQPSGELFADWTRLSERLDRLLAMPARWGLLTPGAASNAWAVNGERTEDGVALLANDPHLAPTMPGIWYQLEMEAPGFHVAGVSLPGVPLVLIGHNEDLAWGFTTSMLDTQDIFVERVTQDGAGVQRPYGRAEKISSRSERIRVRGEPNTVELRIQSTSNGLIVNGILGETTGTRLDLPRFRTNDLLALRTTLEIPERSIEAFYKLNKARSLSEGRAAITLLKHGSQNLLLAHRDGGIAWQVSGAIPQRGEGAGAFPSIGWELGQGWRGFFPPSRNPGLTNPPGYALVTANNRTVPTDFPVPLTHSWMAPYRAERIEEMLNQWRYALNVKDMERMQLDRLSVQARRYQQALARVMPAMRKLDARAWRIADEYLVSWDAGFEGESRSAAFFTLLRQALFKHLFGDELGEDLGLLMSISISSYNGLDEAIVTGRSSFWDDTSTPQKEEAVHIWARALHSAKEALEQRMPEPDEQRLDGIRRLSFAHAFDRVPVLGRLFSVGPFEVGGDAYTVNMMKSTPNAPEEVLFVPSMRVVFTPADWLQTRGILNLGQSGHRLSPYRTDQLADWLDGRSRLWPWNGPALGDKVGELTIHSESGPLD